MRRCGTPPPRTVIGEPSQVVRTGAETVRWCCASLPSVGWTQDDTLGHDAIADEVPQRDELLARAVLRASFKPLGQGAVLLVVEETPRQLDHAPAHPGIAGSGQPLLAAFAPALMGRAGEATIAGHGAPVAHVA